MKAAWSYKKSNFQTLEMRQKLFSLGPTVALCLEETLSWQWSRAKTEQLQQYEVLLEWKKYRFHGIPGFKTFNWMWHFTNELIKYLEPYIGQQSEEWISAALGTFSTSAPSRAGWRYSAVTQNSHSFLKNQYHCYWAASKPWHQSLWLILFS